MSEHEPGPFGLYCHACGKRTSTPTCAPNPRLDPVRMHPLTGGLLLAWMVGLVVALMAVTQ